MKLKKRGIVIPDQHYPLEDRAAVECVKKAILKIKPKVFVNLGDVGEWDSVSAWKYKDKKLPPLEFQLPLVDEEIRLVNNGLDEWDQVLKKWDVKKSIYSKVTTISGWIILLINILTFLITLFLKRVK